MLLRGAICAESDLKEEQTTTRVDLHRRSFLKAAATTVAATTFGGLAISPAIAKSSDERKLSLYATHTGELIRMVYWTPTEGYIEECILEISHVMRDRRSGGVKRIDPKLFDQIYLLQQKLQPKDPIHVLCGYRSPATNAMLRRKHRGVARNSFHMRGMAADLRMPDRDFSQLHKAALSLEAGGVGRYRRSRYIHLDTGVVRSWG